MAKLACVIAGMLAGAFVATVLAIVIEQSFFAGSDQEPGFFEFDPRVAIVLLLVMPVGALLGGFAGWLVARSNVRR